MDSDYRWIIDELITACRGVVPGSCVAWKWAEEDLVPGLSDIDARVICPSATAEDWVRLDARLGDLYRDLVTARPDLARLLEHTPGMGLTVAEMLDPRRYHPEFRSWTLPDDGISAVGAALAGRTWEERDRAYHLKRFAAYLTPYNRDIDPPINVPVELQSYYPYHGRALHYCTPAVLSAASLVERAPFPGKRAALRYWCAVLRTDTTLRRVEEWLEQGYPAEAADWDRLDEALYGALTGVAAVVASALGLSSAPDPVQAIHAFVRSLPVDPDLTLLVGVWSSRIRAGRFRFYLDPPPGFDVAWLLKNEARLVRNHMAASVWTAYAALRRVGTPAGQLPGRLRGALLTNAEADAAARVLALAEEALSGRGLLIALAGYWPDYSRALEKLARDAFSSKEGV